MIVDSSEILFQSFLREAIVSSLAWTGFPLFDVVHPAFPLQIAASFTLHGALKDGFGEAGCGA